MPKKALSCRLVAVLLPLVLLSGCYENVTFKTHKPGKYQGKKDSDTIMHTSDEHRTALRERFRAGQTDR